MHVHISDNYADMSRKASELVVDYIKKTPKTLVSFPGGSTPVGFINEFVSAVNQGAVDISQTRYVSLDEWVGLSDQDEGSCGHFNRYHLLNRLETPFADVHLIDGTAEDIEVERRRLDQYIAAHGPLGVSVLGIGLNGHLGFNEEGVSFDSNALVVSLSPTTKQVMGKYFGNRFAPECGITQGLGQIRQAEVIILLANGLHKADILRKALEGPITPEVPASILQTHPNVCVVIDRNAARELSL